MKKKNSDFTLKHTIAKTSNEEKAIHMRQAYSAILKIIEKEDSRTTDTR